MIRAPADCRPDDSKHPVALTYLTISKDGMASVKRGRDTGCGVRSSVVITVMASAEIRYILIVHGAWPNRCPPLVGIIVSA